MVAIIADTIFSLFYFVDVSSEGFSPLELDVLTDLPISIACLIDYRTLREGR